ncbi:hypothetical protein GCM10023353_18130 [Tomitella cavernea]|uniref:Uncharacterized protein n=1 Tax=Tomitella cavernea TaxID=1387982 RepID=A0ABP9CNR4_9ACTN
MESWSSAALSHNLSSTAAWSFRSISNAFIGFLLVVVGTQTYGYPGAVRANGHDAKNALMWSAYTRDAATTKPWAAGVPRALHGRT